MIQNSANTKTLNLEILKELNHFMFTSWLKKCFTEVGKLVTEIIQK